MVGSSLLQPNQIVDGNPGERRQLLPPKPWGPAASACGEADLGRCQAVPPAAQRPGQLGCSCHPPMMARFVDQLGGTRVPWIALEATGKVVP